MPKVAMPPKRSINMGKGIDYKEYRSIIMNAPFGYAFHKIIVDEKGKPVDYEYLEVNGAFERITGLKARDIIGKTVLEVLPGINSDVFNWIEYYGDIAINGGASEFEQYSMPLDAWYKVQAYSDRRYYFSTVFTDITELKQTDGKLREHLNRIESFLQISRSITSSLDHDKAMQMIVDDATKTMDLDSGAIYIKNNDNTIKLISATPALPPDFPEAYRIATIKDHPRIEKALITGESVIMQDASTAKLTRSEREVVEIRNLTSNLYLPIKLKEDTYGVLILSSVGRRYDFVEEEISLLKGFADQAAQVLHNIHLYNEAKNNELRLQSHIRILQHQTDNIQDFLDYALDEAIQLTESRIGYIYFYSEQTKEFTLNTWSKGVLEQCSVIEPQTIYQLEKTGLWGEAVRQRREIIDNDFQAKGPLKKGYPEGHAPLKKYLTVPIFVDNEIVAVVGVANKESDYNNYDVLQLQLLMDGVWKEVERKKSQKALEESEERFRNIMASMQETAYTLDREQRHTGVYGPWVEQMGVTPDFFLGKTTREILGADANPEVHEEANAKALTGEFVVYEWSVTNDSGKFYFQTSLSPIKDSSGEVQGLVGIGRNITERKLAELEVKKSKEQLLTILNGINAFIYIADMESHELLFINEFGLKVWDEDIKGKKCHKELQGFDEPCSFCTNNKLLDREGNPSGVYEWEFRNKVNNRWYAIRDSAIRWTDGRLVRLEVAIDITEQKQAQLKQQTFYQIANEMVVNFNLHDLIKSLEKHLSQLVDTSNFYVALYDEERGLFSAPFEKDQKDLIKQWPVDGSVTGLVLKRKESVLLKKSEIKDLIERGEVTQTGSICEAWLGVPVFRDQKIIGAIVVQSYNNAEAFDTNSIEILEYLSNHINLALERARVFEDLVRAINSAEESQARFVALHNASFGGILIHDKGVIIDCNQGLSDITGYPKEELTGMNGLMLLTEDSRPIAIHNIERGYEKPYEAKGLHKDGHEYHVRIQARNIPYMGKTVRAAEFRDITKEKEREEEFIIAKEKAEESDRLKSAFLANMSHEIRTPMNGILGFAGLLKEPQLSDDEQQNYIDIINKSGKRMLNIINDIVDISKIEADLMKVRVSASNINEINGYILEFFKPEAEAAGISLSVVSSLTDRDAAISTDHEKVTAILTNLVKNAIKYTERGGIEIGSARKDDHIEFHVKDTGIGIAQERQQAIFERFIQADIDNPMAYQGAGLGLSIAKAYVEMLGGEIWVESEPGVGSTFFFTLPCSNIHNR